MENNNNNNIRINIRDQSSHWNICECNNCLEASNSNRDRVQIQIIYNDSLRNIRMNQLLSSLNFFGYGGGMGIDDYQDYLQDEFMNSLFQQASRSEELYRNEKVEIDVSSQKFGDTEKTFTNCSICSDDYKDDDTVSVLNCKHMFHKSCIEEWGHYNPVCPVCKSKIDTNN